MKMAYTLVGSRFSCSNFCSRSLVSVIFFSYLAMVGKACRRASLMRWEVFLTRYESSERVVMMTKMMSLKYPM